MRRLRKTLTAIRGSSPTVREGSAQTGPGGRRKSACRVAACLLLSLLLNVSAVGQTARDEVVRLSDEAFDLFHQNKYDQAAALAERAVALAEKSLPESDPNVTRVMNNLEEIYKAKGEYGTRAEQLLQRLLAVHERVQGSNDPTVAETLSNLGDLYYQRADYSRAEPLLQRARTIYESAAPPDPTQVATILRFLSSFYLTKGDYRQAEMYARRSLALAEKTFGAEHEEVAASVTTLAQFASEGGDYAQAASLYKRALAIDKKVHGPRDVRVGYASINLAHLYIVLGDYVQAEPLLNRGFTILETALGSEHPTVGEALTHLADFNASKGDYAKAEDLSQRSLKILEKTFGASHPKVADALNSLALTYWREKKYERAEPLYRRALAIQEQTLGSDHVDVALELSNLGVLRGDMDDPAQAEALLTRALAIYEKAFGAESYNVGLTSANLAGIARMKGDYARAQTLNQRALVIFEKVLGLDHSDVARVLHNQAGLYEIRGDIVNALALRTRAEEIIERQLGRVLTSGSEVTKLNYLSTFSREADKTISLHTQLAPDNESAARLALTTVLRRKGRALDAMTDQTAILRRSIDPRDRALLDQLAEVRGRLSNLTLKGAGKMDREQYRSVIADLQARLDQIEGQISVSSADFRAVAQPVTVEQVQQLIPNGAALIEIVSYQPFDPRTNKSAPARYAAYVLQRAGPVQWVDLGEATVVDADVARLRGALRDTGQDAKPLARAMDERVMRPIRRLLGDTRTIFLSPDGALNLIPFAALVDEQNHYLLETYSFTYLTSGRDLLRLQGRSASRQSPTVFANPLYDQKGTAQGSEERFSLDEPKPATRNFDFSKARFPALPGTAQEAKLLGEILPNVKVLTEGAATESALKQVHGPAILHIATHGFFLASEAPETNSDRTSRQLERINDSSAAPGVALSDNPFLRSGIALAGANLRDGGNGDDGILTAIEAANLDLTGTKLVVLSACETGIGDIRNGEGVYGLRRALVLAGAESQLMSLWQVDDAATRDLMVDYYRRLQKGEGRGEALRNAQLNMVKSNGRDHPYYWASFIQLGDSRKLEASGPTSSLQR